MKISRISFIVLIELICLVQIQIILTEGLENFGGLETCLEFTNPLNQYESKNVECPTVKSSSSSLDKRASDNMFDINFKCAISDKDLCDKVENVFNMAGKYITNTLNLKSTINVDAQLVDFCKEMGYCDTSEVVLGAARPSRMLPFQDSDGKTRLYPQALYKQLDVNNHPTFGPSDIKAIFNSRMDYWFRGDPTPMPTNKADILYVVIHEMIHGLGFTNSWNDYANKQALTPTVVSSSTGSTGSTQFAEYVFDRHLVLLPSGTPLTSITDELNQFKSDTTDPDVFFSSFQASPQFSIAQAMYKNATTHGAIGFLLSSDTPSNNQLSQDQINSSILILETSLNPYEPSSSLGHVDMQTYIQTSDFLMMFTYPPGETLDDMMSRAGSTDTGPIGPKLKQLLGILGYNTDKKYTPPEGSNASFISFNLLLFLVCIFLTFINNL